jgi:hypothetical protein
VAPEDRHRRVLKVAAVLDEYGRDGGDDAGSIHSDRGDRSVT